MQENIFQSRSGNGKVTIGKSETFHRRKKLREAKSFARREDIGFLGFGDPGVVSWGSMLYDAYTTGSISRAWWWTLPPGMCITLFVISVFLIARDWELIANPRLAR